MKKRATTENGLISQLHRQAMAKVQDAIVMAEKLAALRREAFELEKQAAMLLVDKRDKEPTRSILFKGAAQLALNCGKFKEGIALADMGLMGINTPADITLELFEIRAKCVAIF